MAAVLAAREATAVSAVPITLLQGDDEVVLRDAVRRLRRRPGRRRGPRRWWSRRSTSAPCGDDGDPLLALVDAAQTPPFLTDFRVVLGRVTEKRERGELVQPLVDYLLDPLPSTRLVLEWRTGQGAQGAARGGHPLSAAPRSTPAPAARSPSGWGSTWPSPGSRSTPEGRQRLVTWVGDEPSRLLGLIDLLALDLRAGHQDHGGRDRAVPRRRRRRAAVGPHRRHRPRRPSRRPSICSSGWSGKGERHPFQVLSTLHTHFARMLRLDGAEVAGEKEAAELLGMKGSTFPAKKAMGQARRLGHDRIVRGHRPPRPGRPRPPRAARRGPTAWCSRCWWPAWPPCRSRPGRATAGRSARQRSDLGWLAQSAAVAWFSFLARRDLRRAAAFLWITPFVAAVSMRFWARRSSSTALSAPSAGRGGGVLGARLQLAADRLVALGALDGLAVALDLALDVGHEVSCSVDPGWKRTGRAYPPARILVTSGAPGTVVGSPYGPQPPPQPVHRGARRPREEHARRPPPRAVRRRRPSGHAGAVPRHDGHRA